MKLFTFIMYCSTEHYFTSDELCSFLFHFSPSSFQFCFLHVLHLSQVVHCSEEWRLIFGLHPHVEVSIQYKTMNSLTCSKSRLANIPLLRAPKLLYKLYCGSCRYYSIADTLCGSQQTFHCLLSLKRTLWKYFFKYRSWNKLGI